MPLNQRRTKRSCIPQKAHFFIFFIIVPNNLGGCNAHFNTINHISPGTLQCFAVKSRILEHIGKMALTVYFTPVNRDD